MKNGITKSSTSHVNGKERETDRRRWKDDDWVRGACVMSIVNEMLI